MGKSSAGDFNLSKSAISRISGNSLPIEET
jgi:hypothetical protein